MPTTVERRKHRPRVYHSARRLLINENGIGIGV